MANAKIRVETDVSGVKKGLNQASKDIKAFERTGKSALGSLGQALGLNVQSIEKMSTAFSGAGAKIAQTAGQSNKQVLSLSKAMGAVGAAAGAAAVAVAAAWKWMSREAEYYGTRLKGMVEASGLREYRETLKALRHDHEDGAGMMGFVEGVKNKWQELLTLIGNVRRAGGGVAGLILGGVQTQVDVQVAEQAKGIQQQLTQLEINSLGTKKKIAQLDADIAEKRRQMADTELTLEQRQKASNAIIGLINEKTNLETGYLQKRLELTRSLHSLTESSLADIQEENALEVSIVNLQTQKSAEIRSVQREQRKLNKEIEKQKELEEANALTNLTHQEKLQAKMKAATTLSVDTTSIKSQIQGGVQMAADEVMIDFGPMLNNSISNLATAVGEAFYAVFSGQGIAAAAEGFGASLLSTLGDLATQFGEMAIAIGTASLGINQAFKPPFNGLPAIAAGAALVALGAGLKAWSSSVTSGGYSTGASGMTYASSSYTSGSSDFSEGTLNIKVSGRLVAQGSQLVAVLDNEAERTNRTT